MMVLKGEVKDESFEVESARKSSSKTNRLDRVRVPCNKNGLPEARGDSPPFPFYFVKMVFLNPRGVLSLESNFVLLKC